jgi:hypothetical protein
MMIHGGRTHFDTRDDPVVRLPRLAFSSGTAFRLMASARREPARRRLLCLVSNSSCESEEPMN